MSSVNVALMVYAFGAAVALWRTDADWPIRLVAAMLWPIGPIAFVATVTLLLAASLIAFPWLGAAVAVLGAAWWWWLT